jgi:uncharacterized protein with HEPN domain
MSERTLSLLLDDIKVSIETIQDFTRDFTFEMYETDLKTRHAVERNFMIIGEAAARIPNDFKNLHPQISWRQVKDFRNFIVHDYFGIDNSIVWEIIRLYLADLLVEISLLQKQTSDGNLPFPTL